MAKSDKELASTDVISEPSMSAEMRGSPPPEKDQVDPEKAESKKEKNYSKWEPEELKDNLHSGVLDGKEKRRWKRHED